VQLLLEPRRRPLFQRDGVRPHMDQAFAVAPSRSVSFLASVLRAIPAPQATCPPPDSSCRPPSDSPAFGFFAAIVGVLVTGASWCAVASPAAGRRSWGLKTELRVLAAAQDTGGLSRGPILVMKKVRSLTTALMTHTTRQLSSIDGLNVPAGVWNRQDGNIVARRSLLRKNHTCSDKRSATIATRQAFRELGEKRGRSDYVMQPCHWSQLAPPRQPRAAKPSRVSSSAPYYLLAKNRPLQALHWRPIPRALPG